jgi:hypothetical protein
LSLLSVVWSPCGAKFFERLKLPLVAHDLAGRPVHERLLPDGALPELPQTRSIPAPEPALAEAAWRGFEPSALVSAA